MLATSANEVIVPSNAPVQRVTRDNGGAGGDRVWMMCSRGAVLVRVLAFG